MLQGLSTSASGLFSAQQRLEAAAHNTANLNIPETAGDDQLSPVEIAVEQIAAAQHFRAGVRAAQTQDQMLGALLDLEA